MVGAHGAESLFATLGARVHHPLLPQAGLQSLTLDKRTHGDHVRDEAQTGSWQPRVGVVVRQLSDLLFATGTEVSTSVLVSHVDSVSLVQLSWYLGSMIASARLPPQPIGKTIQWQVRLGDGG